MAHEHAHPHGHIHAPHQHGSSQGLSEILDLDAEVAREQTADLTARVAALAAHPVRHIVDVGSGTGAGTFALLRRFPEATVTAVDTSDEMLAHLTESAGRLGLAGRVRPLRADLDEAWPALDRADLVWASSAMHHMAEPGRVLRDIHATLSPAGLFVMLEMEHMPRFLPDSFGAGAEVRCHTLSEQARNEHLPHMGAPWPTLLKAAGFTVQEERTLDVEIAAPLPPLALRYARAILQRFTVTLADRLSPADQAALHELLTATGPDALEHRPDLTVRSSRDVWITTRA
ncbi:methyltransferase domain-containing protein [Actinoplanes sp. NPDC051861]|uniref:class I SAM-dependent methyltransferase n=1 Tax=Actinoplanes sp. NPDC051861 TaxID=3155170 RepID=UPI003415CBCE